MQTNTIYVEQSKILVELAEKSDCIIVGRCANHVLRDYKPWRIFIYAEIEAKMKRWRVPDKQLKQHIVGIDKSRASYYKFVTDGQWEKKTNYDLCINTTYAPIKKVAHIVALLSFDISEWLIFNSSNQIVLQN